MYAQAIDQLSARYGPRARDIRRHRDAIRGRDGERARRTTDRTQAPRRGRYSRPIPSQPRDHGLTFRCAGFVAEKRSDRLELLKFFVKSVEWTDSRPSYE